MIELATPRGGGYKGNKTPGVYKDKDSTWYYRTWRKNGKKRTSKGKFSTKEECRYKRHLVQFGHHWYNMPHDISKAFGFLYTITHRATGKIYNNCCAKM